MQSDEARFNYLLKQTEIFSHFMENPGLKKSKKYRECAE